METIRAAERAEAAASERCIVIKHSILWIARMVLKMRCYWEHQRCFGGKTVSGAGLMLL